jgi:ankyrin repeat protein
MSESKMELFDDLLYYVSHDFTVFKKELNVYVKRFGFYKNDIGSIFKFTPPLKVLKYLLSNKKLNKWGLNFNSRYEQNNTLLHFYAGSDDFVTFKYLLKNGSKLNSKNSYGKTPMDIVVTDRIKTLVYENEMLNDGEEFEKDEFKIYNYLKSREAASKGIISARDQHNLMLLDEKLKKEFHIPEIIDNIRTYLAFGKKRRVKKITKNKTKSINLINKAKLKKKRKIK